MWSRAWSVPSLPLNCTSRVNPHRMMRAPTTTGHVAVSVDADGVTIGLCCAQGVRLCNASCLGSDVLVTAAEVADDRWPDALVFMRDMSESEKITHGWKGDPLAAWHFSKYGTGCLTTLERAEAVLKWARLHKPVVFNSQYEARGLV